VSRWKSVDLIPQFGYCKQCKMFYVARRNYGLGAARVNSQCLCNQNCVGIKLGICCRRLPSFSIHCPKFCCLQHGIRCNCQETQLLSQQVQSAQPRVLSLRSSSLRTSQFGYLRDCKLLALLAAAGQKKHRGRTFGLGTIYQPPLPAKVSGCATSEISCHTASQLSLVLLCFSTSARALLDTCLAKQAMQALDSGRYASEWVNVP
jgi:hypothetical protein